MTATAELSTHLRAKASALIHLEECRRQMAGETELRAFLAAVRALFGDCVATRAADDWIALACSVQPPLADGPLNWRYITVLVCSRLATNHFGPKQHAYERESRSDAE